jgi:uncharacterized damage-inducible protein DinB
MMEHLRRLIRYDGWANRETLGSFRQGTVPPRSLRWLAHIVGAEYLWLARLQRGKPALPVWPELTVDDCADHLSTLYGNWREYLDGTTPARLAEEIAYTNSKGEAWTSTVEDILIHVTIHSAYHRGQIASDLRSAGLEPAYTDYIHAARQGLIV